MINNLHEHYQKLGFKALKCAGFHPSYNKETDPEKRYKRAKEAIVKDYTSVSFKGLHSTEIQEWESLGGWVGWLIPKHLLALDVEDRDSILFIREDLASCNIYPPIHVTNNGLHLFFKKSEIDLSATTKVFTKSGVNVTYRIGGKSYLILAPTNGRSWEVEIHE